MHNAQLITTTNTYQGSTGQLQSIVRNGETTAYTYDALHRVSTIGNVFNTKGNLYSRQDNLSGMKEIMAYDDLNRLTNWDVYQNNVLQKTNAQTYNATTGNIDSRTDLDNLSMHYGLHGRPHALDSINGVPAQFPLSDLTVTYTDFNKINTLNEGNKLYTLTYGIDDQRRKSVYAVNGVTKQTHYYLGDYEEEVNASGNIRKIHYLSGGAVLISNNAQDSLLYGYSDYQGSLIALTDESGTVLERYAYDPWGQRRNPSNWTQTDTRTSWRLNRGYTGHEHLDAFCIINMNGRVYDPLTAQFFSPDPFVQAPDNWLNYNRYGYCYNNPFSYTDPDGEVILEAILLSAYIGFHLSGIQSSMNGGNFWDGAWKGALVGAVGGGLGAGFGLLGVSIGVSGVLPGMAYGAVTGAISGGITGGLTSALNGDSFWDGAGKGAAWGAGLNAISGGLAGYNDALSKGNNVWWGTKPENWARNRGQWSMAWWDKPDIRKFNAKEFYNEVNVTCDAATMASIDPRRSKEEWEAILNSYTVEDKLDYERFYKDYNIDYSKVTDVTAKNLLSTADKGYNGAALSVRDYYDVNGEGPRYHRMAIREIRSVPGKYTKIKVFDWGYGHQNANGFVNYSRTITLGNTPFKVGYVTFFRH